MSLYIVLQETSRWTDGWLLYGLYGIVVLAIIFFVVVKIRRGKKHKKRNQHHLRKK